MLSKKIKSFFDLSVSAKFDGVSGEHPIIVLNSIKNIIGDNRKNPSKLLLDFAEEKANQYPLRDDDKEILQVVAKEGVGNSVFISDLEDACQSGVPEIIEKEAARLQWVSDNGLGGFEVLVEMALQDYKRLGVFSFHLLRANNFNRDVANTWPYTRCLVKEIIKTPLPDPHPFTDLDFQLFESKDRLEIMELTSAHRFWNGDYVRKNGYKREISHWYKNKKRSNYINDKAVLEDIESYLSKGGDFFIKAAEQLINKDKDLVYLESLRYLIKNDQSFASFASAQISKLLNNNEC